MISRMCRRVFLRKTTRWGGDTDIKKKVGGAGVGGGGLGGGRGVEIV